MRSSSGIQQHAETFIFLFGYASALSRFSCTLIMTLMSRRQLSLWRGAAVIKDHALCATRSLERQVPRAIRTASSDLTQ